MRERYTVKQSIGFTESQAKKIRDAADKLGWRFSDIVRECTATELPRLLDRENKRTKRRTQGND